MSVTVRKPTADEERALRSQPVWTCGISEFDWYYDEKETCLLLEGEVTVVYGSESVSFGAGDYCIFPEGLSCVWKVAKPVKKHYRFG